MDIRGFWDIVDVTRAPRRSLEEHVADIEDVLAKRPAEDIADFDKLLGERFRESNGWDLWAAAYLINGGCSDDGFVYFRGWLVLQGRQRFDAAAGDADSIAEWINDVPLGEQRAECEDIMYVAMRAFEHATGKDLPSPTWTWGEPKGARWDEDDDLSVRLPRLSKVLK